MDKQTIKVSSRFGSADFVFGSSDENWPHASKMAAETAVLQLFLTGQVQADEPVLITIDKGDSKRVFKSIMRRTETWIPEKNCMGYQLNYDVVEMG